jgi:polar amino acid transport system permease protein
MDLMTMLKQLGEGMIVTGEIFFLTLLFSLPLGLIIAFGRMAKNGFIRTVSKIYISIMRGTPLMLQLIVVYFAPYYVFGIRMGSGYRMVAVILGFVLNYAAYFAEIYRAGIQAIPVGQHEAAQVLGYSKGQTFFKIIFPQVIKRILPPVTNEVITLVKDTSLAFVLTVAEMFTLAKQVAAAQTTVVPLMVAGLFYYIFNLLVAFVMELIEKKLAYYR